MSVPRPILSDYACRPWCEVGIGDTRAPSGTAVWDESRWDDPDALWGGFEPSWLDRSCEVHGASSTTGRDRVGDPFLPGASDVVFRNVDGWADLTGTPDPALVPLRPGRQVRWGVDTPTGRHVVFRGFLDAAYPAYLPDGADTVEVSIVDALAEAGRPTLGTTAPAGAGETVTARIGRVLTAAGWPAQARRLDPTGTTLIATELGAQAVDLLTRAADSGGGAIYGDVDARVVYRARDWQTYVPGSPPDAVIGNTTPGAVCPAGWELSYRRADVAVVARMGRSDGTVAVVTDPVGLAQLGPEPYDRLDLETEEPATLTLLANRAIRTRGVSTMPRVDAVHLDAAHDPGDGSVVELMATARPETPTRVRCQLTQAGRVVFDADLFVTSVAHQITDAGRWTCRLGLDVAAPFAAVVARWDEGAWDRAMWAAPVMTGVST